MASDIGPGILGLQKQTNPRVLFVTPEIAALPPGMCTTFGTVAAKAGGMADVSAGLVEALFDLGADVHVALPNYRRMFKIDVQKLVNRAYRDYKRKLQESRLHLAEDRIFYYRNQVYGAHGQENPRVSLAFQREVINNILPRVQPDLIHCHDWMTGLIPAFARRLEIPCLFTVHSIHTWQVSLAEIENSGIDPAEFWHHLYYAQMPGTYEQTRLGNRVDLLASGIFAAHFVNTVSPTFMEEVVRGEHHFVPANVRVELAHKKAAGCAAGILNAPPVQYDPQVDAHLAARYSPADFVPAKRANKLAFQHTVGLAEDAGAPLLFWPSRLDPVQKGCELLAGILLRVIETYKADGLQTAIVADGPYQGVFHDIVASANMFHRVAITDFDERLSHLAYAAADFILLPSRFEPCGLPQMIGPRYGTLPIVHDTGGLHDTVRHIDLAAHAGNGIVFKHYDENGLAWAIDEAMRFHRLPRPQAEREICRIMHESAHAFNHASTARQYFALYERMLERPLIDPLKVSG